MVELIAALGIFWMMRGEHVRLLVLTDAVFDAIGDWQPPPPLHDTVRAATLIIAANSMIGGSGRFARMQALLRRLGTGAGSDMRLSGLATAMLACDPADPAAILPRLEQLAHDGDRETAAAACYWLSSLRENAGDPLGAMEAAERALELASDDDGPWATAMPRAMLAQLTMHVGDRSAAARHARAALPVMRRLGAGDDEIQLRSLLVFCAIADGKMAEAEAELASMAGVSENRSGFGSEVFRHVCHAELLLAYGDRTAGLSALRDCLVRMRDIEFPGVPRTGLEPWTLFGSSMVLAAHAHHATAGEEEAYGHALFRESRTDALRALGADDAGRDYPVAGMLLFALGSWCLLRRAAPAPDAIRLLVLAERFAYTRAVPLLMWERIVPAAEEAAPGLIADLRGGYATGRPADLLTEACRAVERLPA